MSDLSPLLLDPSTRFLFSQLAFESDIPSKSRRPFYSDDFRYASESSLYVALCRGVEPPLPPHCPPTQAEVDVIATGLQVLSNSPQSSVEKVHIFDQICKNLPGRSPADTSRMIKSLQRQRTELTFESFSRNHLPEQFVSCHYRTANLMFEIFNDFFAYVKYQSEVFMVNLRTGKVENRKVPSVIGISIANERCVFAWTATGKIYVLNFGSPARGEFQVLKDADQFQVRKASEPVFAVSKKNILLYGTEIEEIQFDFRSPIVHFELEKSLAVATENELTVFKDLRESVTMTLDSPIDSFRRNGDSIIWWRQNHLKEVVDIFSTMEMDFGFPICDCQPLPRSHLLLVSGTKEVVVVDDRYPGRIYSDILRDQATCRAAWLGEAEVIAIATESELIVTNSNGHELKRYSHPQGPILDFQTTSTMAVVQVANDISVLQINTCPILLPARL